MNSVYLASMASKSGKSVLSLGLVTNYPGKVGYYKPFRESTIQVNGETMDQDASLMAEAFGLNEGKEMSPFVYDIYEPVKMDDIIAGYKKLCKGKEFMVIEGSRAPSNGYAHNLSHMDIAKALDAPMLLVSPATPKAVDTIFLFIEQCKNRNIDLLGVVINGSTDCPERKFLEDRGVKVLGEVPMLPELKTFRVSEIRGLMNMKVIAGEGGMDNIVETMLVGAMSIQSAIGYMRRSKRKVLITGGDRTE
ncbi:MAG: AAA family ATPase, partial [Methanomassiliicoccaceae archaeon]|nr:AAA family ATPase [Methanomassiliicoccaceae archaeon]